MCERGDAGQPVAELPLLQEAYEEFEIQLSIRDGDRLEGSVLHRRSGRRAEVTAWGDVAAGIARLLEQAEEFRAECH